MRYAQGGGLTDAERAARERLRLEAVERFEREQENGELAAAPRASERSVERWRWAWRERGEAGVPSKGSPGRPRLSEAQILRNGSWSAARSPTAGPTSGGLWRGSRL
ncbi:hypothetical protein [Streptomyces fodineus]|uniref:hypothetical protein n=1 Tax=Streptomyces fodineus TaxID=1904616 RepID=UPI001D043356|nr:hypothetical protein [Streptomyces fodineus]